MHTLPPPHQSITDQVRNYLEAQIRARKLPIGSRLDVAAVARELGVSRTPVDKAVSQMVGARILRVDADRRPVVVDCPASAPTEEPPAFGISDRTDRTFDLLLDRIVTQAYQPGERIRELHLARELGVSQTVVHRASERLSSIGLLLRLPRRGWKVVQLEFSDLEDAFRIRLELEPMVIEKAVPRIGEAVLRDLADQTRSVLARIDAVSQGEVRRYDFHFHSTLIEVSGSRLLAQTLQPALRSIQYSYGVSWSHPDTPVPPPGLGFREHEAILDAFLARDVGRAVHGMQTHLRRSLQSLREAWTGFHES